MSIWNKLTSLGLLCAGFGPAVPCLAQSPAPKGDVYIVGIIGPSEVPNDGDSDPCTNPGRVRVVVGETERPVVLVLSNAECTRWIVTRAKGNKLSRIVAANADYSPEVPNFGLSIRSYPGGPSAEGPLVSTVGGPIGIYPFKRKPLLPANDPRCADGTPDPDCQSRLVTFREELSTRYGIVKVRKFLGRQKARIFTIGRSQ